MKSRIGMLLLLSVLALFTYACAVRTPVQHSAPPDTERLRSISVILREFKTAPNVLNGEMAMVQCKSAARGYLQTKSLFEKVEDNLSPNLTGAALLVDATLTDLRLVTGATRFWAGAMAGRSHMKVLVKISDQHGKQIGQQELFGAPNAMGSAWSFGQSDRDLPNAMGCLIGDYIIAESAKLKLE